MTKYRVRLARSKGEISGAMSFIQEAYATQFSIPANCPEYLFVAYDKDVVVGTLGIITYSENQNLRLPMMYIPESELPYSASPALSVEFGRWVCVAPEASLPLVHETIRFTRMLGKKYVWCEQSASVHRTARRFGIRFTHVSSSIRYENLEQCFIPYYVKEKPSLYVFELEQAESILRSRIL